MKLRAPHLFPAGAFEAADDLTRIEQVLDALPDEKLIEALETGSSEGRPPRHSAQALWRVLLGTLLLGHRYMAQMLRDLKRNDRLRRLCGLGFPDDVPHDYEMSRFVKRLVKQQELLDGVFQELVRLVQTELPDFGKQLAQDGTHLRTNARGKHDPAESADPEATYGVKAKPGTRKDGSTYERAFVWFGYKLHLLVDTEHELPVAYTVTSASEDEAKQIIPCMQQAEKTLAPRADGSEAEPVRFFEDVPVAADKGYDDTEIYQRLHEEFGAKPVIDMRHATADVGTVYDRDRNTRVRNDEAGVFHNLRFLGYEKDREALKYGCPCDGAGPCPFFGARCNKATGGPGLTLRQKLSDNFRYYTAIPRESKKWQREYDRRTAVERVNGRLKQVLDLEYTGLRGKAKVTLRACCGLIVMLGHAVATLRAKHPEHIRSLTKFGATG